MKYTESMNKRADENLQLAQKAQKAAEKSDSIVTVSGGTTTPLATTVQFAAGVSAAVIGAALANMYFRNKQ